MKLKKINLIFSFSLTLIWGANNASVTQLPQTFTPGKHVYFETINFNNTPTGWQTSQKNNESLRYTGIIFDGYDVMHIPVGADVIVNVSGTAGNYNDWAGMLFRGRGREKPGQSLPQYRIEGGGSITFNLGNLPGPHSIEGVFLTRRRGTIDNMAPSFVFDVNMQMIVTGNNFYMARGLFNINDGNGGLFAFNKNLIIDASKMVPSVGWKGSGKGYRSIFSVGGGGIIRVNANSNGSVLDANNIVQLKGDISVESTSTSASRVYINLTNNQSYFQGRFSLQGRGSTQLRLSNGGKWVLAANSKVNILDMSNVSILGNESDLSMVDFISIKDGQVSYDGKSNNRLSDSSVYSPRRLEVDELRGNNGIFKLMANFRTNQSDNILINKNSSGKHYLEIYPDYSNIDKFTKPSSDAIEVARIKQGGAGLDFESKEVKIGLFTFKSNIHKKPFGAGYQWVIGDASKSIPMTSLEPSIVTLKPDPPAPPPKPAPPPDPAPMPPPVIETPVVSPPETKSAPSPVSETSASSDPVSAPVVDSPPAAVPIPVASTTPLDVTPPTPVADTTPKPLPSPMDPPLSIDPPQPAPLFFVSKNKLGDELIELVGIQYRIYRMHTDDLTKHIDELFASPQDLEHHLWADFYAGKMSNKSSQNPYKTFQGGYDYVWHYDKFRWFVGGLGDYTYSSVSSPLYSGRVHSVGLGAYFQGNWYYQKNLGIDIDAYGKYAFSHYSSSGGADLDYNDFKNNYNLVFLNLRIGFKAPISSDNSWFVEPGVRIGWAYIDDAKLTYKTTAPFIDEKTGNTRFSDINIHINQKSGKFFNNKFFLMGGKSFQNNWLYFDVRSGLDFSYDSTTGGDVSIIQDGYSNHPIYSHLAPDYRLGAAFSSNLSIKDNLKFYFNLKRTFFSHVNTDYLVSVGFRMNLGTLLKSRPIPQQPPERIKKRSLNTRKNVGDVPMNNNLVEIRSAPTPPKRQINPNYRPLPKPKLKPNPGGFEQ